MKKKVFVFLIMIIVLIIVVPAAYQLAFYNIETYGDAKNWIEQNQNDLDLIIKYAREKGGSLYIDGGEIRNYRATDSKKVDYLSEEECKILKKAAKRLKIAGIYELFSEDDTPFSSIQFRFGEKFLDFSSNYNIFYVPEESIGEMFRDREILQISDEEWDNKAGQIWVVVKIMDNWYLKKFPHI